MANYDPEATAKLKHIGALASKVATELNTLDGKKFGSADVVDGKINFYATADKTGTPIDTIDLPEEIYLDQTQTSFVDNFAWSALSYPNSTNPNLDGKPVLVLTVKGDKTTNPTLTYSFISLEKLIDVYTAADNAINVAGNSIGLNLSQDAGNILSIAADGLLGEMKIAGASAGNIVTFGASGALIDSGHGFATDEEFAALLNEYFPTVAGGNG